MQHDGRSPGEGRSVLLAAAAYVAFTLVLAWPLAFNPDSGAMPGDPDTDLFVWTLAWNTHALTTDPLGVFDSNIYHPHRRTLAFSENLIGSTLFAAPVLWLTGRPLVALNVVALLSVVLSGVGGYLLARALRLSRPASFVCGMVCAFSPARFFRLGQLHLTTIQWIPFCLAFLHRYFASGRARDLRVAIAFFSLQALASGHGAVFLTVAVILLLAWRFALGEPLHLWSRLRDVGIPGLLLVAPALLIFVPYRMVQTEVNLRRTLADWETTGVSFISSVTPLHMRIFGALAGSNYAEDASAHLFPGFLVLALAWAALLLERPASAPIRTSFSPVRMTLATVTLLAAVALLVAVYVTAAGPTRLRAFGMTVISARDPARSWMVALLLVSGRVVLHYWQPVRSALARTPVHSRALRFAPWRESAVPLYLLLTIVAALLSAGPPLGIWPYVHTLPGLNFIRVPSRFMLLATVSLAVLAAIGLDRVTARVRWRAGWAAAAATAVIAAECFAIPLPGYRTYSVTIPAVDRWLGTLSRPLVIAEVPADAHAERRHSTYMLHSMAHWQKTVHGHSGIRTPLHVDLYTKMRRFPSVESLDALAAVGVTHIVVHPEIFGEEWPRVAAALPAFADRLRPVYDDGNDRAYELTRHP